MSDAELNAAIHARRVRPFADLGSGPLVRFTLITRALAAHNVLLVVAHRIVSDEVSLKGELTSSVCKCRCIVYECKCNCIVFVCKCKNANALCSLRLLFVLGDDKHTSAHNDHL